MVFEFEFSFLSFFCFSQNNDFINIDFYYKFVFVISDKFNLFIKLLFNNLLLIRINQEKTLI